MSHAPGSQSPLLLLLVAVRSRMVPLALRASLWLRGVPANPLRSHGAVRYHVGQHHEKPMEPYEEWWCEELVHPHAEQAQRYREPMESYEGPVQGFWEQPLLAAKDEVE